MTTNHWDAFRTAAPEFAERVEKRFSHHPHHVLGTLRRDGSPRLSGQTVEFRGGELWLGMMTGSRKAADLVRDGRFSLFANPGADDRMPEGDVRISGRAVELVDPPELHRWAEETGTPPGEGHLFRVELGEVVHTAVDGDDLVVRLWTPGAPRVRVLRRTDADPTTREE
ncbi:pyridoxamine 5'-phosphate oxidase family protein [Streptomyces sp. BI20]|uniref:pyridoxamine 5'-phosphate oxidase family protein n=1 Tax=Streptomyces sp. BI20 TaxID=3403460 RepID=UPI003C7911AC